MKNKKLGIKIYKKIIKDFGFISSLYSDDASFDSNLVWYSILKDKEIYSFINGYNIISFWNEYDFDDIVLNLKEFFEKSGKIIIDDDFLIKYSLNEETFIEKYLNII
jgi:hypothetical protein